MTTVKLYYNANVTARSFISNYVKQNNVRVEPNNYRNIIKEVLNIDTYNLFPINSKYFLVQVFPMQ